MKRASKETSKRDKRVCSLEEKDREDVKSLRQRAGRAWELIIRLPSPPTTAHPKQKAVLMSTEKNKVNF
jgi:hypothetical protein